MYEDRVFQAQYDRLKARLRDRAAGKTLWFTRGEFHDPAFRDTAPKSHIFAGRDPVPGAKPYNVRTTALCGYRIDTAEILDGPLVPTLRAPAKKSGLRCSRCERAAAREKEQP